MSGGSYNYAYMRIEDLASEIRPTTLLRRTFIDHLKMVAKACHAIEWVDSGDCGPGGEDADIKACLDDGKCLAKCVCEAIEINKQLESLIRKSKNKL